MVDHKASFFTPEERDDFAKKYESMMAQYKRLCEEIYIIIGYFLSKNEIIKAASITYRVKEKDSFLDKLNRKPYRKPFEEIDDFAGVRVILYRITDIPHIEKFLRDELNVLEVDNKTEKLGITEMGYGGTHMIVSLGDKYNGIQHRDIKRLRCEVQVRTVLQDAWSTMSHSLFYKTSLAMPRQMQRNFNNLASLLEVADSSFERIILDKEELSKNARTDSQKAEFLSFNITIERLSEYSLKKYPDLPINEYWQEALASDLKQLDDFNTLKEIDEAVEMAKHSVEKYKKQRPDLFKSSTDHLTKSIGFVSEGFRKIHPFSDATLNTFLVNKVN